MVEAGKLVLQPEAFSLEEMLADVVAISRPIAKANGNTLSMTIRPGTPDRFVGDRRRIQQILLNLLSNAAKFTREGSIAVEAGYPGAPDDPPFLEFVVSDTGVGISNDDQTRIFEEFVTLDSSFRRRSSGAGLGLSICRGIARAMNGRIEVESEPQKGSRFHVILPLPPADTALAGSPGEGIARAATLPNRAEGIKVLVVEDNEINRFVAHQILAHHGCEIHEAHNGLEGVKMADAEGYDLILMDISMPEMDGVEACRRIREGGGPSAHTPIVGITAHVLRNDQDRFLEAGMDDCLSKPIRRRDVETLLSEYSHGRRASESAQVIDGEAAAMPALAAEAEVEAVFDMATLEELLEVLPPASVPGRFTAFVEALDRGVADIASAVSGRDALEGARRAHELAGVAAIFGATSLREELLRLEKACEGAELSEGDDLVDSVRKAAENCRSAVAHLAARSRQTPS